MSLLTPQIRPYSQFVSTFVSSALEKKPSAFKWPQGRLLAYRQHRITTYLHGSAARPPVLLLLGQHHQLQHRWDVSLEQKNPDIRVHDAANWISIPKRVIKIKAEAMKRNQYPEWAPLVREWPDIETEGTSGAVVFVVVVVRRRRPASRPLPPTHTPQK